MTSSAQRACTIVWPLTHAFRRPICIVAVVFILFGPVSVPAAKEQKQNHKPARSNTPVLGEFEGRKVHVHSDAEIRLKSALGSDNLRSVEGEENRLQYLIRVKQPAAKRLLKRLFTAAGKGNVQYLPHDAYLATLKQTDVARLGREDGIVGIFYVPDALKLQPDLYPVLDSRNAHPGQGDTPPALPKKRRQLHVPTDKTEEARQSLRSQMGDDVTRLHVLVRRRNSEEEMQVLMEHIRGQLARTAFGSHANLTSVSDKKILAVIENQWFDQAVVWLSEQSWVEWTALEPTFTTLNYYGARALQSPCEGACRANGTVADAQTTIWNKGITGEGQVVGVADTGVDSDSCFFSDNRFGIYTKYCSGPGAIPNCVETRHRKLLSYRSLAGNTNDHPDGHGTHVAGSVAGNFRNTDEQYADARSNNGAAPDARICFDDVDDTYEGSLEIPADLEYALFPHSYEMCGARIYSNSWGAAANGAYSDYSMDVDSYTYDHDDFLVLFAAGNSGPDRGTVGPPATSKNCLAIGATHTYSEKVAGGTPNQMAWFTSRGPTDDGRIKPEVSCIGDEVTSARSNPGSNYWCPATGQPETSIKGGTSMATPLCAGGAALVRQYFTEGWWLTGSKNIASELLPTAPLLKAMMINSATTQYLTYYNKEEDRDENQTTPSDLVGFGRVDLSQVLWFGDSTPEFNLSFVNKETVEHGIFRQYCMQSTGNLRVTLVWHDPPSFPGASRKLINNLDLVVVTPSGSEMRGNAKSASDPADDLNNVEHVTVSSAEKGLYLIRVMGTELPFYSDSGQAFALVMVGELEESNECETHGYIDGAPDWVILCDQGRLEHTGFDLPPVATVPAGRAIDLLLTTDTATVERGFYVVYNAPGYETTTSCGVDVSVTAEVGELNTDISTCSWIVSPASNLEVMQWDGSAQVTFEECSNPECTSFHTGVTAHKFVATLGYGVRVSLSGGSGLVRILHTTSNIFGTSAAACSSGGRGEGMLVRDTWGVITDGTEDLTNDMFCRWLIVPEDGGAIELEFKDFAFELDFDYLSIASCANTTALIARNSTSTPGGVLDGTTTAPETTTTTPKATTTAPETTTTTPKATTTAPETTTTTPKATTTAPETTTTAPETTTTAPATTPAPFPNPPAGVASCTLTQSWPELHQQMIAEMELPAASKTVRTGGLGKFQEIGTFEAYVCLSAHACAEVDNPICFVYHEQDNIFMPCAQACK